jgi:hypothetical protein
MQHIYNFFFGSRMNRTEEGVIRVRVIFDATWTTTTDNTTLISTIDEVAKSLYPHDPLALNTLLVKDEQGHKWFFRQVDEAGESGYRNGSWHWEQFSIKEGYSFSIVRTANECLKCDGQGEITYGGVNFISKHGVNRRGCFACGGRGHIL